MIVLERHRSGWERENLKICRNDTKRDCVLKCLMFMAQWQAARDTKYKM
jgi:hypothetical protein